MQDSPQLLLRDTLFGAATVFAVCATLAYCVPKPPAPRMPVAIVDMVAIEQMEPSTAICDTDSDCVVYCPPPNDDPECDGGPEPEVR